LINITGLDFNQVCDYVVSRYFQEGAIAEKMNTVESGGDVFAKLNAIKPDLDAFVEELRQESADFDATRVKVKLSLMVERYD
jgi:hypothetical protein